MGNEHTMLHKSSHEPNDINYSIRCCCNEKPIEINNDFQNNKRPVQNEKNNKENNDNSIIHHNHSYNKDHCRSGNNFIITKRKLKSDTIINVNITKKSTFIIKNIANSYEKRNCAQYNNKPNNQCSIRSIHSIHSGDLNNYHIDNNIYHDKDIKPPGVILSDEVSFIIQNPQVELKEKEIGKFSHDEPIISSDIHPYLSKNLKHFNMRYNDNTVYSGEYNSLWQKEGYGILYSENGNKYEGFFSKDKFNGRGRLINSDGSYFEGNFLDGKANGFGTYHDTAGRTFIGDFLDEMMHGKGEEITLRGTHYEGDYECNMKKGKGILDLNDGSRYEGEFDNNIIHGFGLFKWADGRSYKGQWKNGKMEGYGIFTWIDDKSYIGHYQLDKKVGFGIFIWGNSRIYEGFWENGHQHGYGRMIKPTEDGDFNKECKIVYGKYQQGKKIKAILKDCDVAKIQNKLNVKKIKMLQLLSDFGVKINYC